MFKTCKESFNVSGHGDVDVALDVIPFECDATVECSVPILLEGIVCAEGVDEVVSMFFVIIFDSKIIDRESELNGSCDVLPKSWRVWDFEVSKRAQAPPEELVS